MTATRLVELYERGVLTRMSLSIRIAQLARGTSPEKIACDLPEWCIEEMRQYVQDYEASGRALRVVTSGADETAITNEGLQQWATYFQSDQR
jgi:hypothetical protein